MCKYGDQPITIPVVGYREALDFLRNCSNPTVQDFRQFVEVFQVGLAQSRVVGAAAVDKSPGCPQGIRKTADYLVPTLW
jgi:hypothetical protein